MTVLPRAARLTDPAEFRLVLRRGKRAGRPLLAAHLLVRPPGDASVGAPARAGFVVSKAVGGSVTRHRVQRRLRHLARERLAGLPLGSLLVVRAAPASADADSAALAEDLDRALARLLGSPRPGSRP